MLHPAPSRAAHRDGRSLCILTLLGCLLLLPLLSHSTARAATVRTVNTYADTVNPNDAFLSLREAIALSAAGDVVNFAPEMATPNATGITVLSGGQLVINRALTIQGPGARKLALSGNNASRVFQISGAGAVRITGLTLTRGRAPQSAALPNSGSNAYGGAIHNSAPLNLVACAITDSLAQGGGVRGRAGGGGFGGGIFNSGILTMLNCQLSGNRALSADSGVNVTSSHGGALYSFAPFTLLSTTLAHNIAQHDGGAIMAGGAGTRILTACTVSLNTASSTLQTDSAGGIFSVNSGKVILRNTLVALNYGGASLRDVKGAFTSQGFNFIGAELADSSGGSPWLASDLTGTPSSPLDAKVGTFQNNSGPTDTIALLPDSPALDRGDNSLTAAPTSLPFDQRGLPRRLSTQVDIGAYERDVAQTGVNLVVNSLNDSGDGIAGVGECTLREALAVTNLQADANTITFQPGLTGVISLARDSGPLIITSPVTITGPGASLLAVSGVGAVRVLQNSSSATVTLAGMTIRDGLRQGAQFQSPNENVSGGGILNSGTLLLVACALQNNRALGAIGFSNGSEWVVGGGASGGAILNTGTLTLRNCTLSNNQAMGGTGAPGTTNTNGAARGGAIYNFGAATLTNCTLYGNHAYAGFNGSLGKGVGGAIYNAGSASATRATSTVTLLNCTIVVNQTFDSDSGTGGGLYTQTRPTGASFWNFIRIRNSLVARNSAGTGPDAAGTVISDGNNLVGKRNGSTGWIGADRTGTIAAPLDPQVDLLANNAGPTATAALLAGSPAINNADSAAPATDQRGAVRSGAPDIGAYEFGGAIP